jgi:hypothetical protein
LRSEDAWGGRSGSLPEVTGRGIVSGNCPTITCENAEGIARQTRDEPVSNRDGNRLGRLSA